LEKATDERLFIVAEALRRGMTVERIAELSNVDLWFLCKLRNIIDMEFELKDHASEIRAITSGQIASNPKGMELLRQAKEMRFPDKYISQLTGALENQLRWIQRKLKMLPTYKMVDTCAAEFEAETPYFYSCYEREDETGCTQMASIPSDVSCQLGNKPKAIVIGSGPIRIGQGVEFDYCSVHSAWALREAGYESIIINNNPETVSTDFDTSDRLYFEPLTLEVDEHNRI
jgi:carbamoyl-phosphate synthase large subunit